MIWRYMDVGKFLSLITTETLFFANAAAMEDPYEGFTRLPSEAMAAAAQKAIRETMAKQGKAWNGKEYHTIPWQGKA